MIPALRRNLADTAGSAEFTDDLAPRFMAIRSQLGIAEEFTPEVLADAHAQAGTWCPGPDDARDIDFMTIDPPGSTDLDQAMHLQRTDIGFRVWYAIADVPSFVEPGSLVDQHSQQRGQTMYAPDLRVGLYPAELSENASSLLPGRDRPAFIWQWDLDETAQVLRQDLGRGVIRSRQQVTYAQIQAAAEAHGAAGAEPEGLVAQQAVLLRQIGELRMADQRRRGGVNLARPEQEVQRAGEGYTLTLRPPVPAEDWNAQISLLTGMSAATMMLQAGVGIVRTMPPPTGQTLARLRRQVRALNLTWPAQQTYQDFIATLDPQVSRELAALYACSVLFCGAGYRQVTEPVALPVSDPSWQHAAVAVPYAHATAPLRRLVDRYVLTSCYAIGCGLLVPEWVQQALPQVAGWMAASDRVAGQLERRCIDTVEAAVLSPCVGQLLDATVVDEAGLNSVQVQLRDYAVVATAAGQAHDGDEVVVRILAADVDAGQVRLELADADQPTQPASGADPSADEVA